MFPFANYNVFASPASSMESKKKKKKKRCASVGGDGGGCDELTVVQAAAWAWYQRNEGKPMREFNLTRAERTPKPSRYKVEAMEKTILSEKMILAENKVSRSLGSSSSLLQIHQGHDKFSHLLDTYEIESISKRLDCLPDSGPISPINFHEQHDHSYKPKKTLYKGDKNIDVKMINKRNLWKGILLNPTAVCGKSDDVDLRACRDSRRSAQVSAAKATNHKTPAGHG